MGNYGKIMGNFLNEIYHYFKMMMFFVWDCWGA